MCERAHAIAHAPSTFARLGQPANPIHLLKCISVILEYTDSATADISSVAAAVGWSDEVNCCVDQILHNCTYVILIIVMRSHHPTSPLALSLHRKIWVIEMILMQFQFLDFENVKKYQEQFSVYLKNRVNFDGHENLQANWLNDRTNNKCARTETPMKKWTVEGEKKWERDQVPCSSYFHLPLYIIHFGNIWVVLFDVLKCESA